MGCMATKSYAAPYCIQCGMYIQATIRIVKDGKTTHYCPKHKVEAPLKEMPQMYICGEGIK